jgi:riboflavin synthase
VELSADALRAQDLVVALIPQTLEVTTLGARLPGDTVNIETDLLAKYVERQLAGPMVG